jgi:diguanylate cyclase (GGDEF)-like protein
LTDTADVLRLHIRQADILARIGGDEFVAVIGDASDDLPAILCERLEESIQTHRGEQGSGRTFSFSVGFAWYDPSAPSSVEELLHEADRNMYRKKQENRDTAET